jgi:hypothetical protein
MALRGASSPVHFRPETLVRAMENKRREQQCKVKRTTSRDVAVDKMQSAEFKVTWHAVNNWDNIKICI